MEVKQTADVKTEKTKRPHGVQLDNRKKAVITGVDEVVSMTETLAQLKTGADGLVVNGAGMHILRYNADEGTLVIEGTVDRMAYTAGDKSGFFKRMFK